MLPKYFKGRTLGSFVRQLNMYNFHKVKGQKHRHVFRHPFFKRGDEESLRNIRRKHVGKEMRQRTGHADEKEMHPWNQHMADKLGKMREVLDIMSKQNQDLVTINNRMVNELQQLKHGWQLKSRDLVSLTSAIVHEPNSRLTNTLRAFMSGLGMECGAQPLLTSADVLEFFNAQQGNQFKNEMNIFYVTEQLTSLYKAGNQKAHVGVQKTKVKNGNENFNDVSCTSGSTLNNSSFTEELSSYVDSSRRCNSVDDISQFDASEAQFGGCGQSFDYFCHIKADRAEFDAFMADAFDSLSAVEGSLFL